MERLAVSFPPRLVRLVGPGSPPGLSFLPPVFYNYSMPKSQRRKLREEADKLAKDIVKIRDGSVCQHCQKTVEGSNRHCSHVVPVSAGLRLAYDPQNMKILCYHCHLNWWHKNPIEAANWFLTTFPERWEMLQQKKSDEKFNTPIKDWELEEIIADLKEQLNTVKTKEFWED